MRQLTQGLKLIIISSALIASGCGKQQTAEEHLRSAQQYVAEQQPQKALIELKNALSKDHQLHDARYELGALYLALGDFLAAEIEFNKLINSDFSSPELFVSLAKARHLLEEHQTIPDLWQAKQGLSRAQTAQLGFYTFIAQNRLGNEDEAKAIAEELFLSSPEQTYTKLVVAYQQAAEQKVEGAKSTVETILIAEPNNPEALLFKGQLDIYNKAFADAAATFEHYLTLVPNHSLVELFIADALFKNEQYELVKPYVHQLAKKAPEFGYVNYLQGMLHFTDNKFEEAKLHLEKAIQSNTNIEQSKLYAGLSAYRTDNFEQAYEHLSDVIETIPNNDELRRLLSTIQFKLGYNIEASDSIAKLTELSEKDLSLVNNAAFSYLKEGKSAEASRLVAQASKLDSDNAKEIAKLGMLKVSMEDMSGIVDIKKAIELDSDFEQAKVALVQAYLGQGLASDALDVAKQWVADEPENIMSYNLAGFVSIKTRNLELASEFLNKALELDSTNSASLMFLAGQAQSQGNLEAASEYLQQLTKGNPGYAPGLVNNYLIAKQIGKVEQALELLKLASESRPNNVMIKMLYARALYTEQQYTATINTLATFPFNSTTPEFAWMATIDSNIKLDQMSQAQKLSETWTRHFPNSEKAWATALQLSSVEGVRKTKSLLARAITYFPKSEPLKLMLAEVELTLGNLAKSKQLLSSLTASKNDRRAMYLDSVIDVKEKRYTDVLNRYAEITELSAKEALIVIRASNALGKNSQVETLFEQQLALHPENTNLLFEYGVFVSKTDLKQAISVYKRILSINSNHILALNNLASALLKQGDILQGMEYARKAFEVAPNFLPVISTLGSAYLANKDFKRAETIFASLFNKTKDERFLSSLVETLVELGENQRANELYQQNKNNISKQVNEEIKRHLSKK